MTRSGNMVVESIGAGDAAEYLDVLLLCAAPLDVRPALNLAVEVAHLEAEVRRSTIPIRLRRVFPPTLEQLQRELSPAMLRGRAPRVFHFLGHGEEDYLWFEDEEGSGVKATPARLRRLFEGTPIQLALLNACWSATPRVKNLCHHLVEDAGLATAIGHGKPVADQSAIAFARRFYAEITRGQPVGKAYFAGRNALAEKGLPGAAEIDLTGDGDLRLDEGLAPGERPGRVEDGMPTRGYLPGADFFCGREDEFRQVARTLADPNVRGFGLWGMGGIGKTALAKEAARRNAWRFRDGGVVFVDAHEFVSPTTADLLRRTLARLDPAARGDDPVFELVARLTGAQGLIVLDNLETLPESEYEALARFVGQVPRNGSHVLLTARAPIRPIEDLPDVPTRLLTTGLHEIEGGHYAHWLAETKGVALLRDDPPRIEAGQVRGLCARVSRRVSGHPVMIKVAVLGPARRGRKELDKALDRLTGDLEAKLADMLATGLALVGDEGYRLLAFLPLFPADNFMPEAMRAACAEVERVAVGKTQLPESDDEPDDEDSESEEDSVAWVDEGIRQLERGGFLDLDQETDVYTFHQTLRKYAEREVNLPPERYECGFFGLLLFYTNYLSDNLGNHAAIDRSLDNALALMEMAWTSRREPGSQHALLATGTPLLAPMVDALDDVFERHGLWELGLHWNERAIALRREFDIARNETLLSNELFRRACLLNNLGRNEEAAQGFRESLQLRKKAGDLHGQAAALAKLSEIELVQGKPAEARRHLKRSLAILKGLGDLQGQGASLESLAIIELAQGKPAEARRHLKRSLAILKGLGDLPDQATTLSLLAIIEEREGNPAGARRLWEPSLTATERLGDLRDQATSLQSLAFMQFLRGHPAEARRHLKRSLAILKDLDDLRDQAASLLLLAIIEEREGHPAEARRLWERSLALAIQTGEVGARATILNTLSRLEAARGNLETALGMARESVRLLEGPGSAHAAAREILSDLEAMAAGGSGEGPSLPAVLSPVLERARAAGPEGGLAAIDAALDEARRAGAPDREVVALLARSVVCWKARDVFGCDESLRRATEALARVGKEERAWLAGLVEQLKAQRAEAELKGSYPLYAKAREKARAGDMAGALGLHEASLTISRQTGDVHGVAYNLVMIGLALSALGRADEARDRWREALEVASDFGDEELLKTIQETATMADAFLAGAPSDASARGSDEAPGEPGSTDDVFER
jgi:tetratricopeptide (TPR) repeat protein